MTSNNSLPHLVRLPNLLEQKSTRPRSECGFVNEKLSYGLPGLNRHDSNFMQTVVKRPKTTGNRPNTALGLATNLKRLPEEHDVITSAEMSIYRLSKYNNLIKPEIKLTKTATGSKEFVRLDAKNKRLLEEHVARENESFDKHEVKRSELIRWLRNSRKGAAS